jgi:hypothetical protein
LPVRLKTAFQGVAQQQLTDTLATETQVSGKAAEQDYRLRLVAR